MQHLFELCFIAGTVVVLLLNGATAIIEPRQTDELKIISPSLTGLACSRKENGKTIYNSRNITISSDKGKRIAFKVPKSWKPGEYICKWNIKIIRGSKDAERGPQRQVRLLFRRIFIGNKDENQFFSPCEDELTIKTDYDGVLVPDNDLCGFYKKWERSTGGSNIQMSLQIFVKENEMKNKTRTSFVVHAYSVPDYKQPKEFKVEEIVQKSPQNEYIANYNFTWSDAHSFCKSYAQGWDLCKHEFVCYNADRFYNKNEGTQYFPLVDEYNYWDELNSRGCDGHRYNIGPPGWGIDRRQCPEVGCEAKAYIFCCPYKKPFKPNPPQKQLIWVKSYLDDSRNFRYRFTNEPDTYEYEYDDIYWDNSWKSVGRYPGDIVHFELFRQYSTKAPTPLYFCTKYGTISDVESYKYLISLTPCEQPWKHKFFGYASTSPRVGFTALYFGQSDKGYGTRVSVTPPCCGFNSTGSFVVYGIVRKKWRLSSQKCFDQEIHTGPSGIIKSPLYPENYKRHTTCNWKIRVKPGSRILLQFTELGVGSHAGDVDYRVHVDEKCFGTYLEIFDSKTSYGQLCSNQLPEKFETYLNEVDVFLYSETKRGRFVLNYSEVVSEKTPPQRFKLESNKATWSAAKAFCESKDKTLCRTSDLCPFNTPIGGAVANVTWVAVSDTYNEWIQYGIYGMCRPYSGDYGPPEWGEREIKDCEPGEYRLQSDECLLSRGTVFCCDNTENEKDGTQSNPVRVNIGHAKYTYVLEPRLYLFRRGSNWESPEYETREGYDYYHDYPEYGETREMVKPWIPPSNDTDSRPGTIDYFITSSNYVEGYFDQVIFFCSRRADVYGDSTDARIMYRMSKNSCHLNWTFEFYLYAGSKKTEKTPVALHVGKTNATEGSFCCKQNPYSFTVFVMEASVL